MSRIHAGVRRQRANLVITVIALGVALLSIDVPARRRGIAGFRRAVTIRPANANDEED